MTIREIMAAKLRDARNSMGLTAAEVGKQVGKSAKTIYSWESGQGQPDADMLIKLCRIYNMKVADFYTKSAVSDDAQSQWVEVPLYGSIAAGTPIEMIGVENTFVIPVAMHERYPDAFLLKVEGESMNRRLPNGCYALVDPVEEVIDGRAYAVCVNGYDATIKRVRRLENGFELMPDSTDPTIRGRVYDYGVEGTETVTVIGRVVWYVVPFDYEV